jgi:hypothetical protein
MIDRRSKAMTEAALAQSASQGALVRARRSRLSPLEALERGFALFRSTFARDAWRYYVGATPLVLCLIPIWVINGQIRISNGALLAEVALLVGGYVLRVWMVGGYMRNVRERAFGTPISKPAGAMAQAASVGRLLAWKILLSACALIALPSVAGASWFYSGCQFASLEAPEDGERHSLSGCMRLASQWFGGGVLLFLTLVPLWIAVWLNGAILAIILPQLLHSIFGVNSLLSTPMGIFALIRSSAFWLSLIAGTWLALDPVVKCTFVIVYQHLRSRREGDDLRGLLASLPREQEKKARMIASDASRGRIMTGALFVLATILFSASLTAPARAAQTLPTQSTTETLDSSAHDARIQGLRKALDEESRRASYRWHDAEHPSPPTWFDKLLDKIGRSIDRAWNAILRFLRKLWPSGLNLSLGKEKGGSWQLKDLRLWLTLVAILTLATGVMFFWMRRRHETTVLSIPHEIAPLPDLNDSAVAAERSEDEWFALAGRLEGEGELRFALRATYFGLLVGLAQRKWLTIRRDRTNREYLNEFTRRWRRRPQAAVDARAEIPEKLRGSLRLFDRVWYGLHAVTPEAVTAYRQDQQEFLSHV